MTTKSGDGMAGGGGTVDLEGKMLTEGDPTATSFMFLVMPGATKVLVPTALERSGTWRGKTLGQRCVIRVPHDFAHRHDLLFSQTGGTLRTGGQKGGLGGVING